MVNKIRCFIVLGVITVLLSACGNSWEGDYQVSFERLDKNGTQYVSVKADGITDENSFKAFISKFKADNLEYNSHDSLFVTVETGGKNSLYKVANSDKGSAQTGLEKHTESFEYNN